MTNNDSMHCTLLASVRTRWIFHFMGNLQPVQLRVNGTTIEWTHYDYLYRPYNEVAISQRHICAHFYVVGTVQHS